MTDQKVTSPLVEAEFDLEVVEEALKDAIEDSDQVSLLWAAYLCGFNHTQVVQAWGTDDSVLVQFVSEEGREGALDEYRRLTEER
jgi:hypothetical protein